MKLFKYLLLAILNTLLFSNLCLDAHGFGANTEIKLYDPGVSKRPKHWCKVRECSQSIRQIYDYTLDEALKAKSYNLQTGTWSFQPVKKAGASETNCYMRIQVDHSITNVIECTPSQEFYDIDLQYWIPACQLHVGSHLLRDGSDGKGDSIAVIDVELVSQRLPVYMIEVANDHTFLVTGLCILTHNIMLEPTLFYAGSGVLASTLSGGEVGSIFGPMGILAGAVIGGLTTVGASYYFGEWDRVWYKLRYDVGQVAQVFGKIKAYFKDVPESQKRDADKQSDGGSGGGSDKDPDDDKDIIEKHISDILKDATRGRKTKGRAKQFEKLKGDENTMKKDFYKLDPLSLHDIPTGKAGILKNGTNVKFRIRSTDGRPTLEIGKIKIRYGAS